MGTKHWLGEFRGTPWFANPTQVYSRL